VSGAPSCTKCGNLLAVASVSGLCPACAPAEPPTASFPAPAGEPNTITLPGAAVPPPAADTPNAAADPTPASAAHPNPHAATHTAPDAAETASAPPAPPARPERGQPSDPPGYEIVDKIGRGGMGDVYIARETVSKQIVALKFLRDPDAPELLTRFELEFRALREVVHPNVVRVLGHDFKRGEPYFVMEYLEGGSLAEQLKGGPLDPTRAVDLIRKVAGAVQAMHEKAGILHRDIKPGNILLTNEDEPKLADFGLAKFLDAKTVHTLSGGMLGTLRYMPPEQINGKNGALGYPADVYGLGATLYHLLTGHPPFVRDEFDELLFAVLHDAPADPHSIRSELTRGLSGVVMRCLEKDPRHRYQTVAEFLAALARWAESKTPPPVPPLERLRRWVQRNRVALSACALLALGGAAVAAWPDDPERAILAGLRADRAQTLIGENGPTVPVTWFARRPEREVPKGDAPFGALCPDQSLAVFLSDPGIESYRLSGEFVQDVKLGDVTPGARAPAKTGLLLGHAPVTFGDGRTVHFATTLAFNDYDTPAVPKQDCRLEFEDWIGIDFPLEQLRRRKYGGPTIKLNRPAANDRARRAFTAEVRPTGITAAMNGKTVAFTRENIQKHWDAAAADLARTEPALPPFAAPQWSPRSGIGVALFRTWSSVYDLRIEPLS